jgi:hypothetical protein
LLGWQPASGEPFRECPRDRDHRRAPCAGLDGYAHWFNWRSRDRFEQLAAAVASATTVQPPIAGAVAGKSAGSARGASKSW